MSCEQIKTWLGPYVDGEVPPETRVLVEAHVTVCAACADELESLCQLAETISRPTDEAAPPELWAAIERHLDGAGAPRRVIPLHLGRALAAAAVIVMAVGLGLFSVQWGPSTAQAATVDFGVLLDGLKFDPQQAFAKFLSQYEAREVSHARAMRHGRDLNFAMPETLPGGFRLVNTYALHFGRRAGVAARYERDGELLGAIFHAPVLQEDFGTHEDRDCVVGRHRGHAVEVGQWSLVHVTDPACHCQGTCRCKATCHCILSRLDQARELPAVMAALAPALLGDQPLPEHTGTHHP